MLLWFLHFLFAQVIDFLMSMQSINSMICDKSLLYFPIYFMSICVCKKIPTNSRPPSSSMAGITDCIVSMGIWRRNLIKGGLGHGTDATNITLFCRPASNFITDIITTKLKQTNAGEIPPVFHCFVCLPSQS